MWDWADTIRSEGSHECAERELKTPNQRRMRERQQDKIIHAILQGWGSKTWPFHIELGGQNCITIEL